MLLSFILPISPTNLYGRRNFLQNKCFLSAKQLPPSEKLHSFRWLKCQYSLKPSEETENRHNRPAVHHVDRVAEKTCH